MSKWDTLVCRKCDHLKPENEWRIGPQIEGSKCPDCDAPLFGMRDRPAEPPEDERLVRRFEEPDF